MALPLLIYMYGWGYTNTMGEQMPSRVLTADQPAISEVAL